MSGLEAAREAGASAVESIRGRLVERAADLIRDDPEMAATAVEVGLVDRSWLEHPTERPFRTAPALDMVHRFLERSSERQPSVLAALGLSTLQVLSADRQTDADAPDPTPITVVFTDLEGFTKFTAREGDDAARSLLGAHHLVVGPVVRSRGGRIVKRLGDGLMLTFPNPEAGVLAALELVAAEPGPLRLRAGVHSGEVVVLGDDVIGHDVNLAARVCASAKGGQVLATTSTRDAVGTLPGASFGRARRRVYKGVGASVSVCPVQRADVAG
jgi:adenylate cyclase